jgi:uncharacterized protein YceH (UPF0502 family)
MNSEASPRPHRTLTPEQRRVLGVLIEKAKTTPAGYPMTVNAIVAGCNQKNNREPITAYDDFDVEKVLSELQALGVVKEIDWVGRVPKYKHLAYEWLGVSPVEVAVLAELLLRGPQSLGDLRGRAARMEAIEDLAALKPVVDGLLERHLVVEITPPGRGQLVSHDLYPPEERQALLGRNGRSAHERIAPAQASSPSAAPSFGAGPASQPPAAPVAAARTGLEHEIAALREEMARLAARIERLESRSR